jgi:thiol-disulfide isomerase/thioredoxin
MWFTLAVLMTFATAAERGAELGLGWFDLERDDAARAAERAVALLRANPADIAAHRLYIGARIELDGQSTAITRQYRAWYDADPTDDARKVSWALAMIAANRKTGPWCRDFATALAVPPASPEARFWAARAAIEAHDGRCPGDPAADAAEIINLSPVSPDAAEYAVYLRIRNEPIDPALGAQLGAITRRAAWRLRWARHLWRQGASGDGLEAARAEALTQARAALSSEDIVSLNGASEVFKAAGLRAEEQQARAASTQPAPRPGAPTADALVQEVRRSKRVGDARAALTQLEALAARVPESSAARSELEMERAERLGVLARGDEALEARRRAWLSEAARADGDSEQLRPAAAGFALAAAIHGAHLSEARMALDTALAALDGARWQDSTSMSGPWTAWAQQHAQARAELVSLRAWLSWRMGEKEAGRADAWRALELYRLPRAHLLLGLISDDLGNGALAEQQLAFGLALATPKEAKELLTPARKALEAKWADGRHWHAGGLDGFLAELRVAEGEASPAAAAPSTPSGTATDTHPLIGQRFPIEAFTLSGAEAKLSDRPGVMVVDLWATWCGPCIQSMPHLNEVAEKYHGKVHVLALSVDSDVGKVTQFLQGKPTPAYTVGWVGPAAQRTIAASGIPAQFVLDAEHRVVAYFKGYRSGSDTRLEDQLDQMLPH